MGAKSKLIKVNFMYNYIINKSVGLLFLVELDDPCLLFEFRRHTDKIKQVFVLSRAIAPAEFIQGEFFIYRARDRTAFVR